MERPKKQADASSILKGIARLPPGGIITLAELAQRVGKHTESIKRAIQRGELPRPVHFCGVPAWTVDSLVRHHELRQKEAMAAHETRYQRRERVREISREFRA